jgi:hypothetical protein
MMVDSSYQFIARDGTPLLFYRTSAPLISPKDIADINKRYEKDLGVRVRNSRFSNEYNCHGLTFVAKLGWFDNVPDMLRCHGYTKIGDCPNFDVDNISTTEEIMRGDVVVYYNGSSSNPTHTGIVWAKGTRKGKLWITVLSKWGAHSEYFHRHDKVPVLDYGTTIEIWTDRII